MLRPFAETLYAASGLIAAVIAGRNFDAVLARTGLVGPIRAAAMDMAYSRRCAPMAAATFCSASCSSVP